MFSDAVGAFAMSDVEMNLAAIKQPPFAEFLGMKITHVSPERVSAELVVREELNNRFDIMHGGDIMALAHNLGGTATTANLKDGQSTTTIESKTNFFASIPNEGCAKRARFPDPPIPSLGKPDAESATRPAPSNANFHSALESRKSWHIDPQCETHRRAGTARPYKEKKDRAVWRQILPRTR